jgi:predicted small secreted protein
MRIMIVLPILLLSACNVAKDNANNTTTLTINEDLAQNTAANVSNDVQNIAADVGNDVKNASEKVKNTDVDVKVDTNTQDNKH